ncbi:MAG TPA: toll/interleukin-1 receptor domain-containing protein [Pyrinomonadaceae bacterium]
MKRNKAIGALNRLLKPEVKYVEDGTDLKAVSRLDELAYGGESINHKGLCSWWRAYPRGIYVLWKDFRIIGAVGIWPLKKATYDRLVKGKIDEPDIKAQDISGRIDSRTYSYWYFADIVLEEQYQDTDEKLGLVLLEESLRQWLSEGNLAPQINVCALGFEQEGISFLQNFNFLPVEVRGLPVKSPEGKPVYTRVLTIKELQQAIDRLSSAVNRDAGDIAPARPFPRRHEYDVFISYRRRQISEIFARLIQSELERKGLNVFLDADDLRQGRFDEALRRCIRETANFIPILSPGCFDRCSDRKDWFRQEIAYALKEGKNIIPIIMRRFKFPKQALPANIKGLPTHQNITYQHEGFKAMIERIIQYLQP